MAYQWDGTRILQKNTSLVEARFVLGHLSVPVVTDLREWIASSDHEEIHRVVKSLDLPNDRSAGSFDRRARLVWEWIAREIRYVDDLGSTGTREFWQFPSETIALQQGDCEDSAVLLATLLLAAGISPFCVRVVIGEVTLEGVAIPHAWPIYKDEHGCWRILEATVGPDDLPAEWPRADAACHPDTVPCYTPALCFNRAHVWLVGPVDIPDVRGYVETFRSARKARGPAGLYAGIGSTRTRPCSSRPPA